MLLLPTLASAQKPKWVNNTPQELNPTYRFVEVISVATTIEAARMNALHKLALDEKIASAAKLNVSSGNTTTVEDVYTDNGVIGKQTDKSYINLTVDGEEYTLQATAVDEYVAGKKDGMIYLHVLYMVAVCEKPFFDNAYITTSYGVKPMFMSIIPGWGQIYKGSVGKGIAIIATEAVAIGGIIYTENMRATYASKMRSQPRFAKQYKSKADNFEIARNCCIGAAAAMYVYNLIDAIVAPGARRVVVKPRKMQFGATASNDFCGLALSYSF